MMKNQSRSPIRSKMKAYVLKRNMITAQYWHAYLVSKWQRTLPRHPGRRNWRGPFLALRGLRQLNIIRLVFLWHREKENQLIPGLGSSMLACRAPSHVSHWEPAEVATFALSGNFNSLNHPRETPRTRVTCGSERNSPRSARDNVIDPSTAPFPFYYVLSRERKRKEEKRRRREKIIRENPPSSGFLI